MVQKFPLLWLDFLRYCARKSTCSRYDIVKIVNIVQNQLDFWMISGVWFWSVHLRFPTITKVRQDTIETYVSSYFRRFMSLFLDSGRSWRFSHGDRGMLFRNFTFGRNVFRTGKRSPNHEIDTCWGAFKWLSCCVPNFDIQHARVQNLSALYFRTSNMSVRHSTSQVECHLNFSEVLQYRAHLEAIIQPKTWSNQGHWSCGVWV